MESPAICITLGLLISLIVSALKSIPVIKQYPKWTSFILASLLPVALNAFALYSGKEVQTYQDFLYCIAIQFGSAVTTHETITHTIKNNVI